LLSKLKVLKQTKINMAKETIVKDNPVTDALRKLKDDETELLAKLRPVQEAIGALEKIVDKSGKKAKATSGGKDNLSEVEEGVLEAGVES
jgi:hypothetical protein